MAESPTASPTPTVDGVQEREKAISAALAELDARHVSPLTLEACARENPDRQPCVDIQSSTEQAARGLARFSGGDLDGGPFTFLMGRMADGEWRFWLGTRQMTYVQDALPGRLLACGSEVAIRERPEAAAEVAATLAKLDEMEADGFVLTEPGSSGVQGTRGTGWYHVVSPAEGWVEARETTAATLGDCLLHDEIESRG